MSRLLYVTCHPLDITESKSLAVGRVFLDEWKLYHPDDNADELDLYKEEIPSLTRDVFSAWQKIKAGAAFETLSPGDREKLNQNDKLLNQFIAANRVVFVNPMWNHFFPPLLKQYIDLLCVVGRTFRYTPQGYVGLLDNKKVLHIQSAGGVYDRDEAAPVTDYGSAYLRHMMAFFGVTNYDTLFIEGADAFPNKADEITAEAKERAKTLSRQF